ncbi:MAG TPA: hypothetical protein VH815_14815, partial [Acidobacteriota bacterium]
MFWDRFTVLSITFVPAFVDSFWRGMIITLAVAFLVPRLRLGAASRHKLWLAILILICVLPFLSLFVGTSSLKSVGVRSFQASQPIFNVPLYAVQALLCSSITLSVIRMIALAGSIFSLLKLRKSSGEASIDLQKLLQQCVSEMNLKRSVSI